MALPEEEVICDLLMGAAYADDRLEGTELTAVKQTLQQTLRRDQVPEELLTRLESFDPAQFDARAAARRMRLHSDEQKRRLLELVATIHQADGVVDVAEDEYLRIVAAGLGLLVSSFHDLTIDHHSLGDTGESLFPNSVRRPARPRPPPLPK